MNWLDPDQHRPTLAARLTVAAVALICLLAIALLIALPSSLEAQIPSGYVQTTATVAPLANGSFGASWTNLSSSPQLGLLGCVSTFQQTVSGAFDAYGHFSVPLADTAQICPTPSTWSFTFTFSCPVGQPASAFTIQVAVTGGGGTEDISSQITAALPATSCSSGGGGGGNLSGSGTAGYIPLWTGLHSLGNSPADYAVTTPATFTFPYRVNVGPIPNFKVFIGPLSTMLSSWNFDTTTPATALASLGGTLPALNYQTLQAAGAVQPQEQALNFTAGFTVTDDPSNHRTNVALATAVPKVVLSLPATTVNANTCSTTATASLTGVVSTSTFSTAFASNPTAAVGWGANGGLVVELWPDTSPNVLDWSVCNQTSSNITPTAITLNVGVN